MKHFVGEHLTVSLMETGAGEPFIRVAKEKDLDHFMDMDVHEWSEMVNVIHMIDAARKFIGPMVPHIVGMMTDMDEDPDD